MLQLTHAILSRSLLLIIALLITGCARSAPDLPPDLQEKTAAEAAEILKISADDLSMSCKSILSEMDQLNASYNIEEATIRSHRGQNQAASYLGLFFFPAYLATESDSDSKKRLDSIQHRFDQLYYLKSIRQCGTP